MNGRRIAACSLVGFATLVTSGCSTYPVSSKLQSDITRGGDARPLNFAGDIAGALDAANDQRLLFLNTVKDNTKNRQILGTSLIVLSAAAVYKGINSDSNSTKQWLAKAGALGGAAYIGNSYLYNDKAEGAYLAAYKEITCSILWTRPLLIPRNEFDEWAKDVNALEDLIRDTDLVLSRIQGLRHIEQEQAGGDKLNGKLESEFRNLYDALSASRKLLENSRTFQRRIETSGFTLRRRVESIVANVAVKVHGSENALPNPSALVSNASNVSKTYTSIKPVEQGGTGADEAKIVSKGDDSSKPDLTDATTASTSGATNAGASQTSSTVGKAVDKSINAIKKSGSDKVKQLEAKIKKLQAENASKSPAPSRKVTETDRLELRAFLSKLYAQHRKVNRILIGVNELKNTVKELDPCRGDGGAILTLSPEVDELVAEPGKSYQFSISGGRGVPRAWLVGANSANEKAGLKLSMTIDNGVVIVKVTVPDDAASGVAYLVVTDGAGIQKDEVVLKIQGKASVPAPGSAK